MKAADHQSCPNQQNQRQGNFNHDQGVARAISAGVGARPSQSLFECLVDIRSAQMQRGKNAGDDSGENGNRRSKPEDLGIDAGADELRQLIGKECHDQSHAEMRIGKP